MDLELIKLENSAKEAVQVMMYVDFANKMRRIAEIEGCKVTSVYRHAVNVFLKDYEKGEKEIWSE